MSEQTKIKPRETMNRKPVFTVPAKTVINFDSGFAPKLLCDGPTFTAGTCCPYSCSFCSVPTTMRKHMVWMRKHGVVGEHADIVVRRENAVEIVRQQLLSHSKTERAKKKVIYSSPLTDVAANMELVRETVEICKLILTNTAWDIRLLSKSNLLPKITEALEDWDIHNRGKARIIYGVSTGTLDDKLAAAFEEGTPLVSKRIQSLHWLQDKGFRTFGMICPSLPQNDYVAFAKEMAEAIRVEKCEHVWAEIINVRGASFTRTIEALINAGFTNEAQGLEIVSTDKSSWEDYARNTFEAHAQFIPPEKLRFLQYTTKDTRDWWTARKEKGAVVL